MQMRLTRFGWKSLSLLQIVNHRLQGKVTFIFKVRKDMDNGVQPVSGRSWVPLLLGNSENLFSEYST